MDFTENKEFERRCAELAEQHDYNLYDLVLYDNGRLYRYEHQRANPWNNSYSVSKMFTMAAIGFLYDEGKIDLDESVCALLADEIKIKVSDEWKGVTVRHALAHKMGIDHSSPQNEEITMQYDAKDFLSHVLSDKIVHTPGKFYCYSDGAYYILSRIVTKITGQKLDDFLMERLFAPLDFSEPAWGKCPYGYPLGGDSLYCRTEDMIKLGIILLNGGVYEGRRFFSEKWVSTVISENLGMLPCEKKSHGKTGAHGQLVAFCPETGKAVAMHAFQYNGNYDFRGAAIRELIEK